MPVSGSAEFAPGSIERKSVFPELATIRLVEFVTVALKPLTVKVLVIV